MNTDTKIRSVARVNKMTEEIKLEVIKKTQDNLGKYVKKPPLTEKLLKKPPFRFLHDIITTVIRDTGFLQGLLTPEESNHENIKDRDSKIAFLQKVIDAVRSITGVQLTVRPTKIVAGHEATKTNEFLQAIARGLDKKLSSVEYVTSLQKKDKTSKSKSFMRDETGKNKTSSTSKSSSQGKSQSQDRSKNKDMAKKKSSSQASRTSKIAVETKLPTGKHDSINVNTSSDTVKKKIKEEVPKLNPEPVPIEQSHNDKGEKEKEREEEKEKEVEEEMPLVQQSSDNVAEDVIATKEEVDIQSPKVKETVIRPQSAHRENRRKSARINTARAVKIEGGADTPMEERNDPTEPEIFGGKINTSETAREPSLTQRIASARPKTAVRPASARPAAPRIRDRGEVIIQEEIKPTIGKVHVITESDPIKEQDEFDNFIVVEAPSAPLLEEPIVIQPTSVPQSGEEGQHGHLVAQILETQKELEDDAHQPTGNLESHPKKVEIEWEAGQRREREVAGKEVDRLRTSIQTLTRAANPLGKLMDFLQEDVDAMQRELDSWRTTNAELRLELAREQSSTERSIEPMRVQLQQLQQGIQEKLDQLSALKATILRNDNRIQRLLVVGAQQ